jgi:hypothetical protein
MNVPNQVDWKVLMRRFLPLILTLSLLASSCSVLFPEPTQDTLDQDNLDVFVSEGATVQAKIKRHRIVIVLDPDQRLDTSGVIVTLVNLGDAFLVESADPEGRYLPAVQFVPRTDEQVQQILLPQVESGAGWSVRLARSANLELIKGSFIGNSTLENLNSFLRDKILGRGINFLLQVPETVESFQELLIYRTPGTMTFLVIDKNLEGGGGGSLLSMVQPTGINLAAVSIMADSLLTTTPMAIVERAQIVRDGIFVAQAEPTLPPPDDGPYDEEIPLPECQDDEVLIFREEDGETIPECQAAPWLNTTPVPTATLPPAPTATATDPGPTATATEPPPTPTATPPPIEYTESFPAVDPAILGACPAWVHDRYSAEGPDGNDYRTWHPITVPIDLSDPESDHCSFAHEHGDPPHLAAPPPYFGYVSYHANLPDIIKQHEGYKVFTHLRGQLTGWNTEEYVKVNPDLDIQFWIHQGSSKKSRLTDRYHDAGFWAQDPAERQTEVYYLADTGDLSDKCGSQGKPGPMRAVASECDHGYEMWHFGGNIAGVWTTTVRVGVINPMNFMRGNPNFLQSLELVSTSDAICGVNFFPCSYKLPFGHPNSIWLGNLRMLHTPAWQWNNAGGLESFCTDVNGKTAAESLCNSLTRGYLRQHVSTVNFFGGNSEVWDRTTGEIADALRLPLGAPGGN